MHDSLAVLFAMLLLLGLTAQYNPLPAWKSTHPPTHLQFLRMAASSRKRSRSLLLNWLHRSILMAAGSCPSLPR